MIYILKNTILYIYNKNMLKKLSKIYCLIVTQVFKLCINLSKINKYLKNIYYLYKK